jgi:fructose-bisphosphate aldolase class I
MSTPGQKEQQQRKIKTQPGFLAALDQSGGSTPKALLDYGIKEGAWANDEQMFALVHQMRARIITSPSFNGDRILGAILFEGTMDRDIEGQPTADYLWNKKRIVPFLKVDKGLAAESDGVHLMKPMPGLLALLNRANEKHIFGTKMRSVINQANATGIGAVVRQQFEVAAQILAAGLVPIIEPEVDIHCPDKATAEMLLKAALHEKLNMLPADQVVMLKLTLPERDDFYAEFVKHPKVLKVVALSEAIRERKPTNAFAGTTALWRAFHGRWSRACRPINPTRSSTPCSIRPFRAFTKHPSLKQGERFSQHQINNNMKGKICN